MSKVKVNETNVKTYNVKANHTQLQWYRYFVQELKKLKVEPIADLTNYLENPQGATDCLYEQCEYNVHLLNVKELKDWECSAAIN